MECCYCGEKPARDDDDFCSDDCARRDEATCAISQDAFLRGMQEMVHLGNLAELDSSDPDLPR